MLHDCILENNSENSQIHFNNIVSMKFGWPEKMVLDKMARTKWYGQNGTDKMVATFIDFNSTELTFIQ